MYINNSNTLKKKIISLVIFIIIVITALVLVITQVSCCFDVDLKEQLVPESETISDNGKILETETAETTSEVSTELQKPDLYLISRLQVPGQAIDVKSEGGYAYLTNDLGILYVIDVRDKENPVVVGKCTGIDSANIVIIRGDYVYISYTSWIAPEETGKGSSIDSEGENADIYSICGFKIVDIRDKKNPEVVGDYISGSGEKKYVQGIYIDRDHAYLNTTLIFPDHDESSMEVIDIEDKKNPGIISKCIIEGQPNGLFVQGGYAYVNNAYYDFQKKEYENKSKFFVIDIKDKKNAKIVGSCEVPANSWAVYVKGDKAYLTSSVFDEEINDYTDSILQVVDISDPHSPQALGKCSISGGAWEIDSKGYFLLISNNEGGISAVDISDSNNPFIASILNTGGNSYDIAISGDYGYVADGFEGMKIIGLQKEEDGEGMILKDFEEGKNHAPVAGLDVFGDKIDSRFLIEDNPVFFSAIDSYDPDDDRIEYEWKIDGARVIEDYTTLSQGSIINENDRIDSIISEDGNELVCFFEDPGKYNVSLSVTDGVFEDEEAINIEVTSPNNVINIIKEHNFDVELECTLLNNSNILLKDIECFLRTPQSYYPYQVINSVTPSIQEVDEVFDKCRNLITHFEFDKSLEIDKGQELKASIISSVTMCEYDFKNITTMGLDYEMGDKDLKNYTGEDLFIDIYDPVIVKAVRNAVGDETDPIKKAKKIYDYVIGHLYYDYPRAEEKNYEFMNASDILKTGKGVCADYAILYTALLRASKIPSRIVAGVPVMLILGQQNSQLDVGHAWVEIKLPGYGWIPVDITQEDGFMNDDYFLNLSTEKGTSFLYEKQTMDWGSYYFDGFKYEWDGNISPDVEQTLVFRIKGLSLNDIVSLNI